MTPLPNSDVPASFDRRRFLTGAAVMGAALAADPLSLGSDAHAGGRLHKWSSRRTWGGRVPGRNDVVRISKPVLLDVDAHVKGVIIKRGGSLVFHRGRSITLRSRGNVTVYGRLEMAPSSSRRKHRLVFVGVDEKRFRGGGMKPLASDVGLWVMGGVLHVRGAGKRAWTRAAKGISPGATRIQLRRKPSGWRVGDEVVITPTLSPSKSDHHSAFDRARIKGISGRTIRLSRPTKFAHPKVEVGRGKVMSAEVLNLSRNVTIQGTPRRRSHIFIRSNKRQVLRNAEVRFMGPRHKDGDFSKKIVGRWCVHFHHCRDGSRGSVVRGVVVRDSGAHAFVPHASHGIRFVDCIAYRNLETPFWWDAPTKQDKSITKGTLYQRCVAALVNTDPPHRGGTGLMGFQMAQGSRNVARRCVAVGILGQNSGDSSGFGWIANANGLWTFEQCVSHNNMNLGTKFWINNHHRHVVREFVAYHNRVGAFNGAYANSVNYVNSAFYRNEAVAVSAKATSPRKAQQFVKTTFDQEKMSDYCIDFNEHVNDPSRSTVIRDCSFKGYKKAALGFTHEVEPSTNVPDLVDVVDCSFSGNEFWLGSLIHADSRIRVQDSKHGSIQLSRWDQVLEGDLRPEWNARVKEIRRFA